MSASGSAFTDDFVTIHHGDCLDVMRGMEAASVDAIVTDPPYGLGFMGREWDHGVPGEQFWREALRVAKPGAHIVAFGGTRTYHRLAVAIEDAGWEIRDCLGWLYGSGFPKSLDVSKAIDKAAGAERAVVGPSPIHSRGINTAFPKVPGAKEQAAPQDAPMLTAPATPEAAKWSGYGTALKPAFEPVIWATKPIPPVTLCATMIGSLTEGIQSWQDTSSRADTSESQRAAVDTVLSTLSSWRNTLAGCFDQGRTSTTSTESETTTDWRTLSFCLSRIMREGITLDESNPSGSSASASPAERYFSATLARLAATHELSALESAIAQEAQDCRDEGANLSPNWEPIILARKPLGMTVAACVQEHGTGALNIDGCRVEFASDGDMAAAAAAAAAAQRSTADQNANRTAYSDFNNGAASLEPYLANMSKGRWPANIVLSYPQDEYELRRDVTPEQFAALRGWLDENSER